jgi:hypothetical protein
MRRERSLGALRTGVGRQHLAYIGLRYAKLSRNERRFDTRLQCCPNGIDLPARQRDSRRFNLPPRGRFARSCRRLRGLKARSQSASPPHFLESCRMEQVQFAVAQVLDSGTEVLRQHMSLRGRVGCYLCGRYRLYWRWRTVSDRLGREEVGRRLLTTITSHEGIVPPPTSASNFGRKCSPRRAARRRRL